MVVLRSVLRTDCAGSRVWDEEWKTWDIELTLRQIRYLRKKKRKKNMLLIILLADLMDFRATWNSCDMIHHCHFLWLVEGRRCF